MSYKANVICGNGLQLLAASPGLPHYLRPTIHPPSCRYYATAHEHCHDCPWPTTSTFTPYDIFKQSRLAPYSKARFYELVKVYHPDVPCNGHPLCKDISPEVRLQRYRLVVTANEILSDPEKRAAYDQFGAGWGIHQGSSASASSWQPGMRRRGPMYKNATWEDWEKWHDRDNPDPVEIVDHRTFIGFIFLVTLLGSAVSVSWVGKTGSIYDDKIREMNDMSSRFLAGRRENTAGQMKSTEARVQHFLIRRDPSGSGLSEEEQPVYNSILNPRASVTYNAGKNAGLEEKQSAGTIQPS